MRRIGNSFLIAFAMFSRIPVPRADWDKENMKYMVCFFPAVGLVIGLLLYGYGRLCALLGFGTLMRSAGCVLLPVAVTGGIHLDGFLDTVDALSSCQPKERKLEILKDPHAGAFAVIMGCAYFIACLGAWSEVEPALFPAAGAGFVLSRSLSGLALTTFPCANKNGSLGMFADAAQKRVVRFVLVLWLLCCALFLGLFHWKLGFALGLAAAAVYGYYYHMARKEFGGTTGDIAGFFVQACELAMVFAVMLGGKLL